MSFDVLIIGGGLIGVSLARALTLAPFRAAPSRAAPLRVGLVEAKQPVGSAVAVQDGRSIALAFGSQQIFKALDLWKYCESLTTPIQSIHVSNRGHFGRTVIDAHSHQVPQLGSVISMTDLLSCLYRGLEDNKNLTILNDTELTSILNDINGVTVAVRQVDETREIHTRLLVACDGTHSTTRTLLGIATQIKDYDECAMVCRVQLSRPHHSVAYERMTEQGTVAVLPLQGQQCAVIWTVASTFANTLREHADKDYLRLLEYTFGRRLGPLLAVEERRVFPLKMIRAVCPVAPRVVLLGNASHTLHPIAAQGFNLGLRDVAVLAQVIATALGQGEDIGSSEVLSAFVEWRRRDQDKTVGLTDGVASFLPRRFLGAGALKSFGLLSLDLISPLKQHFARQAMGLSGKLPDLSMGLPLWRA